MELPFFCLKTQKSGLWKYILVVFLFSLFFFLLDTTEVAICVFFYITLLIHLKKTHTIVVFSNEIVEKDYRGRFCRRIYASQIQYYQTRFLNEIHLIDHDEKILVCIESCMTNRERLMQWLTEHKIESKIKEQLL